MNSGIPVKKLRSTKFVLILQNCPIRMKYLHVTLFWMAAFLLRVNIRACLWTSQKTGSWPKYEIIGYDHFVFTIFLHFKICTFNLFYLFNKSIAIFYERFPCHDIVIKMITIYELCFNRNIEFLIYHYSRPISKGWYQVFLPAWNGLWYLLILKSVA
jgi:hypothetical protein